MSGGAKTVALAPTWLDSLRALRLAAAAGHDHTATLVVGLADLDALIAQLEASPLAAPAPKPADDPGRCAVCGWTLDPNRNGCARGDCSMRPLPERFYQPARAAAEYGYPVITAGGRHRFDTSAGPVAEAPGGGL